MLGCVIAGFIVPYGDRLGNARENLITLAPNLKEKLSRLQCRRRDVTSRVAALMPSILV